MIKSKIKIDWSKMTKAEWKKLWDETYQEMILKYELDYWRDQLGKNWRAKIQEFLNTKKGREIKRRILDEQKRVEKI